MKFQTWKGIASVVLVGSVLLNIMILIGHQHKKSAVPEQGELPWLKRDGGKSQQTKPQRMFKDKEQRPDGKYGFPEAVVKPQAGQVEANGHIEGDFIANQSARTDGQPQRFVEKNFRNLSDAFYKLAPDIFDAVPKQFLQEFKNPCWRNPPSREPGARTATATSTLRCLPYFFLAGMPKSGTTDVYNKLHKHPQIIKPVNKEPHWWTRHRFEGESLESYVHKQSGRMRKMLTTGFSTNLIIGDSSASTLWDTTEWRKLSPDHQGRGPRHILNEIIHTVLPDAKIIVILRNPIDRMYSEFNYFSSPNRTMGPSIFHRSIVKFLEDFQSCRERTPDYRTCAYHLRKRGLERVYIGMYSVYLRDWLEIFPRDQIKVLQLEDWHEHCPEILPALYDFLQLRKLRAARIASICDKHSRNVNRQSMLPMLPETRQLLRDFYQPLNVDLAELLGDDKYLWNDGT